MMNRKQLQEKKLKEIIIALFVKNYVSLNLK